MGQWSTLGRWECFNWLKLTIRLTVYTWQTTQINTSWVWVRAKLRRLMRFCLCSGRMMCKWVNCSIQDCSNWLYLSWLCRTLIHSTMKRTWHCWPQPFCSFWRNRNQSGGTIWYLWSTVRWKWPIGRQRSSELLLNNLSKILICCSTQKEKKIMWILLRSFCWSFLLGNKSLCRRSNFSIWLIWP